jgi:hypothetical protein
MTPEQIIGYGYVAPKQFPSGEWAALRPMVYTTALCVGLDESSYARRFCYTNGLAAILALAQWDGVGDPPGPWLVEKGGPIPDRRNPARFKGVRIVLETAQHQHFAVSERWLADEWETYLRDGNEP